MRLCRPAWCVPPPPPPRLRLPIVPPQPHSHSTLGAPPPPPPRPQRTVHAPPPPSRSVLHMDAHPTLSTGASTPSSCSTSLAIWTRWAAAPQMPLVLPATAPRAQVIPELLALCIAHHDALVPALVGALAPFTSEEPIHLYACANTLLKDTASPCATVSQEHARILLALAPTVPPTMHIGQELPFDQAKMTLTDHIRWILLSGHESYLAQMLPLLDPTRETADTGDVTTTASTNAAAMEVPFALFPALLDCVVRRSIRQKRPISEGMGYSGKMVAQVSSALSEVVCDRLDECGPKDAVRMVQILTGGKVPMDEFWLFMLAKHLQKIVDQLGAVEVTSIGSCFASRALEDDEFFTCLTQRILFLGVDGIPIEDMAKFVFACGRVRYRDEQLLSEVLNTYRGRWSSWSPEARAHLIAGLTDLDTLNLPGVSEVVRLLDRQTLRYADRNFIATHLFSTAMYIPAGIYAFRHLVKTVGTPSTMHSIGGKYLRRYIYVTLLARLGGFGDLRKLPLASLHAFVKTQRTVEDSRNYPKRGCYEPDTSGFQIEVSSILKILQVDHQVEVRRMPFILDLVL
eukprot:GEMP01016093.1.p1 GENE.GEMP01016093.1~~GEMP01016093.1.p1  ORF type:complete len:572 (+),score=140.90 GEMP01016093.1:183-1898(+)